VTQAGRATAARGTVKSGTAFRTTGEVAEDLDLQAHVLRFWETKFPELKPLKRGGGRRYYRPEDVDLLRRIRQHLYQEGYTIRGVQKLLREGVPQGEAPPPDARPRPKLLPFDQMAGPTEIEASRGPSRKQLQTALEDVRSELLEIRALLDELLAR
jgi:DNA-binding transcriptional MerR regulator